MRKGFDKLYPAAIYFRQTDKACPFVPSKINFILDKRAYCVHGFSVGMMRLFVRKIIFQGG